MIGECSGSEPYLCPQCAPGCKLLKPLRSHFQKNIDFWGVRWCPGRDRTTDTVIFSHVVWILADVTGPAAAPQGPIQLYYCTVLSHLVHQHPAHFVPPVRPRAGDAKASQRLRLS